MRGYIFSITVMVGVGVLSLVLLMGDFPGAVQTLAFIIAFLVMIALGVLQLVETDHIY